MKRYLRIAAITSSFFLGIFCITRISPEHHITVIGIPLIFSIFCNWLVIFENQAVRKNPKWPSAFELFFEPVEGKWTKPVEFSIFALLSYCSVFFILGTMARIVFEMHIISEFVRNHYLFVTISIYCSYKAVVFLKKEMKMKSTSTILIVAIALTAAVAVIAIINENDNYNAAKPDVGKTVAK